MKKLLAILMALAMVFSLIACAKEEAPAEEEAVVEEAEEEVAEEEAEEEAAEEEWEAPEVPELAVNRVILWDNAIEGLTASDQPRGSETRPAYAFKDVIEACGIEGTDPCVVIGSDGYAGPEAYDDLVQKYMTTEGDAAPIVVGEAQDPDWAVWEVAYVVIGSDVLVTTWTDEIPVKDIFAAVGMEEADSYDFICTDGYTATVDAAELDQCSVKVIDGRTDGIIPGVGDDSLWALLYIQPHK